MSKRSNREGYPDYVKFSTRFDPGTIQRNTGLPASLIVRARKGEVENFSPKTLEKFRKIYDTYWENRLNKAGITPDNWGPIIQQNDIKEVREIVRGVEDTRKLDRKLERGGVNPLERYKVLEESAIEPPSPDIIKRVDNIINKNLETAEKVAERRRNRDKDIPGYTPDWHKAGDILKQMAQDNLRIPSDWAWIAKYGSPKRKKGKNYPGKKRGKRSPQYEH